MKVAISRRNGTSITLDGIDTGLTLKLEPDGAITLDDEGGCTLAMTRVESIKADFHAPPAASTSAAQPTRYPPISGGTSTVPRAPTPGLGGGPGGTST